ncbi:MAG: metallophosphoesterase family protein [Bacteroidia bacterium]
MKTIGIISDTHGYIHPSLFNFFEPCEEIWHAGDWGDFDVYNKLKNFKPLKAVYGNIDGIELRQLLPEVIQFNCEDLNICMLHIGGYPGKYSKQFKQIMAQNKPDVMICGHSHILRVLNDHVNKILHINPGAAGKHGFHKKSTAIKLIINNKKPTSIEVWETDK